jgi:predicted 3-demethylubiquinone-9 3-methyltransferase (glyoxalase superfamily)
VRFQLLGREFLAFNGGPHFRFTDAISLMVPCRTQREIDAYWRKLSKGGEEVACGWLEDKFGVSWQIVPEVLEDLIGDDDPEASGRVIRSFLKMTKLDIAELRRAHGGSSPAGRRRRG